MYCYIRCDIIFQLEKGQKSSVNSHLTRENRKGSTRETPEGTIRETPGRYLIVFDLDMFLGYASPGSATSTNTICCS